MRRCEREFFLFFVRVRGGVRVHLGVALEEMEPALAVPTRELRQRFLPEWRLRVRALAGVCVGV